MLAFFIMATVLFVASGFLIGGSASEREDGFSAGIPLGAGVVCFGIGLALLALGAVTSIEVAVAEITLAIPR